MTQADLALDYKISERRFPSEYVERLVPLLVRALDIIEEKRTYDVKEVSELITKLNPYCRDSLAEKCRSELVGFAARMGWSCPTPIKDRLWRRPKQSAGQ